MIRQFVCPECGGPKSKAAKRCNPCATAPKGVSPPVADPTAYVCPGCGGEKYPDAIKCMECRKDNPNRPFPIGSTERARHGCICTFENEAQRVVMLHRSGPPSTAVREACEEALALDPTFRLVSYSTPSTIFQDLQGRQHGAETKHRGRPTLPEAQVLAQAGMKHMLHPRLAR